MILFYDEMGRLQDPPDFIELGWNRKYREPGNFTLYMPAREWKNKPFLYIQIEGRKETAIVQKVVYEKKTEGDFVTISGFFIEKLLDWGCNIYPETLTATKAEDVQKAVEGLLAADFSRTSNPQLGKVSFAEDTKWPARLNVSLESGTGFGTFLYNWLEPQGLSWYAEPLFKSLSSVGGVPKLMLGATIHIYSGSDKSKEIYFSEGFKNVSSMSYVLDESKEYPIIGIIQDIGEHPEGFSGVTTVHTPDGDKSFIYEQIITYTTVPSFALNSPMPFKVIKGQVSGVEIKPENEAAIRAAMKQQAATEQLNFYKLETLSLNVIQNTFYYLSDYDLGDKCTAILDDLEKMFTVPIVEVDEVHRNNTMEIRLTLGTPRKTRYRQIQTY